MATSKATLKDEQFWVIIRGGNAKKRKSLKVGVDGVGHRRPPTGSRRNAPDGGQRTKLPE